MTISVDSLNVSMKKYDKQKVKITKYEAKVYIGSTHKVKDQSSLYPNLRTYHEAQFYSYYFKL